MAGRSSGGSSSRSKVPTVEYRHNVARARHELGVVVDGQFVAFATLDDAVVAQRVENAAATAEPAGDELEEGGE